MTDTQITVPATTPPHWANQLMVALLKTPMLQRWLGRDLMLLTFTGHKSGREYTIPVSYARDGTRVLAVTKLFRHWWRNFETRPDVRVRLAGRTHQGVATAFPGDASHLGVLHDYLKERPMDAKAYGVRRIDGEPVEEDLRELLPQVVLIRIELTD